MLIRGRVTFARHDIPLLYFSRVPFRNNRIKQKSRVIQQLFRYNVIPVRRVVSQMSVGSVINVRMYNDTSSRERSLM